MKCDCSAVEDLYRTRTSIFFGYYKHWAEKPWWIWAISTVPFWTRLSTSCNKSGLDTRGTWRGVFGETLNGNHLSSELSRNCLLMTPKLEQSIEVKFPPQEGHSLRPFGLLGLSVELFLDGAKDSCWLCVWLFLTKIQGFAISCPRAFPQKQLLLYIVSWFEVGSRLRRDSLKSLIVWAHSVILS